MAKMVKVSCVSLNVHVSVTVKLCEAIRLARWFGSASSPDISAENMLFY